MRRTRKFIAALAVGSGVVLTATPAFAAAALTASPSSNLNDGQTIRVTLSGWLREPAQVSLIQCKPGSIDISGCEVTATEQVVFFDLDGSGTATSDYTVKTVPGVCDSVTPCSLFAIENPANFGGPNAACTAVPCSRSVEFTPLTFASAQAVVPEAPVNLLLPFGAVGVFGLGAFLTLRRRQHGLLGA